MVKFDDNEFEIAIATYKRPEFIQGWLDKCYRDAKDRNISISIYDSSPDDKTKSVVENFNEKNCSTIQYKHVDDKIIIGYKPMLPILASKAKYLWVSGDSRCHKFEELDEKIFPYVKRQDVDYIVINIANPRLVLDIVYDDMGKMFHDVFIPSTCIGLSIYRVAIFDPIRNDEALKKKYDKLFKNNYGFAWLGYFYNIYAMGHYKTLLADVQIYPVLKNSKIQSWAGRFYECWAENICQIIDNIPDTYTEKASIPKNTWQVMNLNSFSYGYRARKYGDLNKEKYEKLVASGTLERITDSPQKIKFFATAPIILIDFLHILHQIFVLGKRIIKKSN